MTPSRRLAAILAADVAGYSAAMERDEEGTAAAVRALRREVIEPQLAEHHGRLIKTTGDGFLAEFASPIAALNCAMVIQQRSNDGLQLRIGLNLGDVIVEDGGDVLGEGVNVAARLEGLARPGGILISDKIHREVEGKVAAEFEDRGEQQVKNITRPVLAYEVRIVAPSRAAFPSPEIADTRPLSLPDKPSIAVLPFQNMSGDPEQEYFADGVVEDIITALSRFKSLFVIARNSSFTYKGKAVDIKQVGRDLGVRYVLEGSVRKVAGRVRITGQLIEAATGAHIWADRYDGPIEDIFDLQDKVTQQAVMAIAPRVQQAEIARSKLVRPENLKAYDYYLRGLERASLDTREGYEAALEFAQKAIAIDPGYAAAYALAGKTFGRRLNDNMIEDRAEAIRQGETFYRKAIALGPDDEIVLSSAGLFICVILRDPRAAQVLLDRAIALNPNLMIAYTNRAWVSICLGKHEEAIALLDRSLRLNPLDPFTYLTENALAYAYFFLEKFEQSIEWSGRALARRPDSVVGLRVSAFAHAMTGAVDRAREIRDRISPRVPMTIAQLRTQLPSECTEDLDLWCEAGRRLGMSE